MEDKQGRSERPSWMLRGFREAVLACGLTDLPLEGYPFTWVKSRRTDREVEERLDRDMATSAWLHAFPDARLLNLLAPKSYHSPIILHCKEICRGLPPRCFKFENAWLLEPDMGGVVKHGWDRERGADVIAKLGNTSDELSAWSRRV